jgi:hypothetical protein
MSTLAEMEAAELDRIGRCARAQLEAAIAARRAGGRLQRTVDSFAEIAPDRWNLPEAVYVLLRGPETPLWVARRRIFDFDLYYLWAEQPEDPDWSWSLFADVRRQWPYDGMVSPAPAPGGPIAAAGTAAAHGIAAAADREKAQVMPAIPPRPAPGAAGRRPGEEDGL